jgi:TolC family type I secretion outer membrane protein
MRYFPNVSCNCNWESDMKFKILIKQKSLVLSILYFIGILFCYFYSPKAGFSQTTRKLSLHECVDIALKKNPEMKSAKERLIRTRLQIREAYSSILPKLSTNFEYTHKDGTTLDNYIFSLSLQQPIFDQGKYFISRPQANLSIKISELSLEASKQNVLLRVIRAYINTLKAEEMLAIARDSKDRLAEHLRVTKRRFEVGQVAKNDVLRAEMELANSESDLIHSEKALVLSYETLKKIIFIEDENLLIRPIAYIHKDQRSMKEMIDIAYEKRPDYHQVVKAKDLTKKGISLAKTDFFPQVTIFGEYERSGESFFPDDDVFTVGGNISVPIFEGGIRGIKLRRARHDHSLSEYQEAEMKKQIRLEVIEAFLRLEDLLATLKAIDKQIEHAQENMRIVKLRYQEGEATNLDVLDANLLLVKARTDFVTLNYDILEARFAIEKAIGELTIEKIRETLEKE